MGNHIPTVLLIGGPDVDSRLELMRNLSNEFHMVCAGSSHEIATRFVDSGFDYHFYSLARRVNPVADLMATNELVALCKKIRPQIVHTFDTKPGVIGRLAARISGVPIVIGSITGLGSLYIRDDAPTRLARSIYEQLQRLASSLADLTIFHNHDDRRHFVRWGIVPQKKATIVHGSGVRTERFNPAEFTQADRERVRRELSIPQEALVVTMISRVIRSKGVVEFAAAAQVVCKRHPKTHFLLIGSHDDDSLDNLTQAERDQLMRDVHCPGPRTDIPAILASSDIGVLPSYREGLPRVLIESAAMGLPLVAADTAGCNDIVEHGKNGFLVPIRNAQALAHAISLLIEQPQLRQRFGEESRRRVLAFFDLHVVTDHVRGIYNDLLTQSRSMRR